jgi:hypothetical protein
MAQVALAWLRHRSVPVIPIIGARKVSQLQANLASLELDLSAEQVNSLDEASSIEAGYGDDCSSRCRRKRSSGRSSKKPEPLIVALRPTLFAGLSKRVDLRLVSRLEFGSGAVTMRYEPRR